MKWKLTTNPPKKSGEYLVIVRFSFINGAHSYGTPTPMGYSKANDAWNCSDNYEPTYKMKDLRDAGTDMCVYAWYEVEAPTIDELNRLEEIA